MNLTLTCTSVNYSQGGAAPLPLDSNTVANSSTAYVNFSVSNGDTIPLGFGFTFPNLTAPLAYFPGGSYTLTLSEVS